MTLNSLSQSNARLSFSAVQPEFHTLSNGLRVALCPLPHLHSVGIGLYAKVGPRFETSKNTGITHFLEHVLFRGNARYASSFAMNRAFEAWGGSLNGYTTREFTYFFGRLHPDYLREGIEFMGDFVREPSFAGVELEREIILEERLEDVDEDGQDLEVDDISRAAFWGGHALGHKIIGTPNTLRPLQQEDLHAHFARFFKGENLVLCVTGYFEPKAVLETIRKAFEVLPADAIVSPPIEETPVEQVPVKQSAFVTHDSSQVSLQVSFLGVGPRDPDFAAAMLLERVLDDGMSSRLWQRIVEEQGLCYELWAGLDIYHDISLLDVGGSVLAEKVYALVEAIFAELRLLEQEGPSEEEFELARRRWRFELEYSLDQVESWNERLGSALLFDLYVPLERQMERMSSVTPQDLCRVCKRIFQSERLLLAAVGPMTKSMKRRLREYVASF